MEAKKTVFSEDEYGRKIDRCLTDTLIKGGMYLKFGKHIKKRDYYVTYII